MQGNESREKAITSVQELYRGFIERYGHTECRSLTGCDFTRKEDVKRYYEEEIYKERCFNFFRYVSEFCLEKASHTPSIE